METRLLQWLSHYGPSALFFAQMLGIFGLPIPDEFLLTVAGALAREGHLPIGWTLLAAIAGAFSGITLSYVVGRTIGMAALRRVVHVSDASFGLAQRWFHRYGRWLLMFGYYIPGVRHCTALAAGSAPLQYREFALFAYTGGTIWCLSFLTLGYLTGPHWRTAWHALERMGPYVFIPILTLLAIGVFYTWRRTRSAMQRTDDQN